MALERSIGSLLSGIALAGVVAATACISRPTTTGLAPTVLTIAVLADSQIQTDQTRIPVLLMTGKLEDSFVDVSIRPPALNRLSPDLLEHLIDRLVARPEVDVVLYLGDAANNGCADEFQRVRDILWEARRRSEKPIFFVIGNHDYLGAGNTTYLSDRMALCDQPDPWGASTGRPNLPLTKFELMRAIHEFNSYPEHPRLGGWQYADNFEEEAHYRLCLGKVERKHRDRDRQHSMPGCFLVATVRRSTAAGSAEIVLLDTSDYADKAIRYTFPLRKEYFGLAGWISTKGPESQGHWLAAHEQDPPPDVRVFASHFPPDSFGLVSKWLAMAGVIGRLADVFVPEPPNGVYWVAGHTHKWLGVGTLSKTVRARTGPKKIRFTTFGVGSTTDTAAPEDAFEPPHAAVLGIDDNGTMSPQRVEADVDCQATQKAVDALRRIRPYAPTYLPVRGKGGGKTLLGLDKSYRRGDWTVTDEMNAMRNLETFVLELETKEHVSRKTVRLCLALESSLLEQTEWRPFSLPRFLRGRVESVY